MDNTMEPLIENHTNRRPKAAANKPRWPAIAYNSTIRFLLWSFFGYILFLSVVDIQKGKGLFSLHPLLLTCSVIKSTILYYCHMTQILPHPQLVLMTESMMCFSADNVPTYQLVFKTKLDAHFILQVAASLCALAGFVIVFVHKSNIGKYHFKTFHGIFGLAALVCVLVTSIFGNLTKFATSLRHLMRPASLKIVHAALGLINYKLFVVTSILGLYSGWFMKHGTNAGFYGSYLALLAIEVYVVWRPIQTMVARIKSAWRRANQS